MSLLVIIFIVLTICIAQVIIDHFKCKVCLGIRMLNGHNSKLDLTFTNDPCYACSGKIFKKKSEWYTIAIRAGKERKKLEVQRVELEKKRKNYASQIKISKNCNLRTVKIKDTQKKKQFKEYMQLINSKMNHYYQIEKNAHIAMYNYYIYNKQMEWDKDLEEWGEKNIEGYQNALTLADEAELTQRYSIEISSFESLLESDVNTEIAKELRLDIEKATAKLKALFAQPS